MNPNQKKIDSQRKASKRWYEKNKERLQAKQREYDRNRRQVINEKLERLKELEKLVEERGIVV